MQGEDGDLVIERSVARIEARHEAERAAEAAAISAHAADANAPAQAQDDVPAQDRGVHLADAALAGSHLLHTPWGSIEGEAAMYLRLTQSSSDDLVDFGSKGPATTEGVALTQTQSDHGPADAAEAAARAAHEESTGEIMREIIQFAQAPASEIGDAALARAADAAVHSNPFMPHVERILIFDAPYVIVPVFLLMPNVAMVSEDLVKDKLPAGAAAGGIDFTLDEIGRAHV